MPNYAKSYRADWTASPESALFWSMLPTAKFYKTVHCFAMGCGGRLLVREIHPVLVQQVSNHGKCSAQDKLYDSKDCSFIFKRFPFYYFSRLFVSDIFSLMFLNLVLFL